MNRIIYSLLAGVIGVALLLAGLGWDAWLHGQDETLAAREGIFTLTNPGHALLATGIALACGGIFSALHAAWGMSGADGMLGRRAVRHGALGLAAWASVGAVAFALSVSSAGHAHGDVEGAAAHMHEASLVASAPVVPGDMDAASPDMQMHEDGVTHPHEAEASMSVAVAVEPSSPMDAPVAHADADQGTMALADTNAAAGDDAHMHANGDGTMAAADHHDRPKPTAAEMTCLRELTAEAKTATARFTEFDVALAEGYKIPGPNPLGEPGTHYPNRAYMLDGAALDLANPETLIYVTSDDGTRRFVGVMYRAAKGNGPQPCGNATWWHTHNACIDPATGAKTLEAPDGSCAAGLTVKEGQIEMMHLWFVPRGERRS